MEISAGMKKYFRLSWSLSRRGGRKRSRSQTRNSRYVSEKEAELPPLAAKPVPERPQSYIAYRPASYQPAYIPREYTPSPPPCSSPSGDGPYSGDTAASGNRTPSYPWEFPQKYPQNKGLSTVRLVSDTGSSTSSSVSTTPTEHRYQYVHYRTATPPPEVTVPLSELLSRYNAESVTSYLARLGKKSDTVALQGLRAPAILGLAPSLREYGLLWQARYCLEVQLPHRFDRFRERFRWAEIPTDPITGGDGTYADVVAELVEVIGMSVFVLWAAWASGGGRGDLRHAGKWVEEEISGLQRDWTRYMLALE